MEVNLQVVGIFYNARINVTDPNPTVKSLLDAAHLNPAGNNPTGNIATAFNYSSNTVKEQGLTGNDKTFAASFSATFDKPVSSRVLGQKQYDPGIYELHEDLKLRPAYTVWQYYMFDDKERYLNKLGNATPFVDQPLTGVPVQGSDDFADVKRVSWRLVSVLAGPTRPLPSGPVSTQYIAMLD